MLSSLPLLPPALYTHWGMTAQEILRYFENRSTHFLDLLEQMVLLDTPTGDLEASRKFTDFYRRELESCNVQCREIQTASGVHLVGDWRADGADETRAPEVTISAHSDTVWPRGESTRRPPVLLDGRFHGPGVYDMRGGLMLALALFSFLRDHKAETRRSFRIFVGADEERGSIEARPLMEREVPQESIVLVPEPPSEDAGMKVKRKGVGIYELETHGLAAHAGLGPGKGVSAIEELLEQIAVVHSLRDEERGVTINVGRIEGGVASNVIADHASAAIDVRFERLEDGKAVDQALKTLQPQIEGSSLELTGGIAFPPMVPGARSLALAEKAIKLARGLGESMTTAESGGGSDGSYLSSLGCAVLDGLGLDGAGAHSLDEHVIVERIPFRAAFLTRLALELE